MTTQRFQILRYATQLGDFTNADIYWAKGLNTNVRKDVRRMRPIANILHTMVKHRLLGLRPKANQQDPNVYYMRDKGRRWLLRRKNMDHVNRAIKHFMELTFH